MRKKSKPDINVFIKNMFTDFDKNKDGLISFEEFKSIKTMLFGKKTDEELKHEFDSMDADKTGTINLKGRF